MVHLTSSVNDRIGELQALAAELRAERLAGGAATSTVITVRRRLGRAIVAFGSAVAGGGAAAGPTRIAAAR